MAHFSAIRAEGAFNLDGCNFRMVPDFVQAHFAEAPRLDKVVVPIPALLERWTQDQEYVHRSSMYRALRRIAAHAHDHEREQLYFAAEVRSLRGNPDKPYPSFRSLFRKADESQRRRFWSEAARFWFGLGYDIFSNFGRSVLRPLSWWGASTLSFALIYLSAHLKISGASSVSVLNYLQSELKCIVGEGDPWMAALFLSIKNGLIFVGVGQEEKVTQIYTCLFGGIGEKAGDRFALLIPDQVAFLTVAQNLVSAALIFLFLLAVRNRFKLG